MSDLLVVRKSTTTSRLAFVSSSTSPEVATGFESEASYGIQNRSFISPEEAWIYYDPEALASVRRGLQQAREGHGRVLSFAQYADED